MAVQQLANSILEPEWIRMAVSALSVKELTVKILGWPARNQKRATLELATFLGGSCIAFLACSIWFLSVCTEFEAVGGSWAPKGTKGIL